MPPYKKGKHDESPARSFDDGAYEKHAYEKLYASSRKQVDDAYRKHHDDDIIPENLDDAYQKQVDAYRKHEENNIRKREGYKAPRHAPRRRSEDDNIFETAFLEGSSPCVTSCCLSCLQKFLIAKCRTVNIKKKSSR